MFPNPFLSLLFCYLAGTAGGQNKLQSASAKHCWNIKHLPTRTVQGSEKVQEFSWASLSVYIDRYCTFFKKEKHLIFFGNESGWKPLDHWDSKICISLCGVALDYRLIKPLRDLFKMSTKDFLSWYAWKLRCNPVHMPGSYKPWIPGLLVAG